MNMTPIRIEQAKPARSTAQRAITGTMAALALVALYACSSMNNQEQRALSGGALGAAGGAAIGLMTAVFLPLTVVLLCFIMGLQNAVITKISRAVIRTTHITGLLTDLGIELGKLLYVNRHPDQKPVRANRDRLRVHGQLIASFFVGGLAGALGFKYLGYVSTVPLAALLLLLVMRPALDDFRR